MNLQHLLEDLRDVYTASLEETIFTKITANPLDSGATRISFQPRAADGTLTVVDDGRGMKRRALGRYHDVAAPHPFRGPACDDLLRQHYSGGVSLEMGLEGIAADVRTGGLRAEVERG